MASMTRCVSESESKSQPAVTKRIERGSFTPGPEVWARCLLRPHGRRLALGHETGASVLAELPLAANTGRDDSAAVDARFALAVRKSRPMGQRAGARPRPGAESPPPRACATPGEAAANRQDARPPGLCDGRGQSLTSIRRWVSRDPRRCLRLCRPAFGAASGASRWGLSESWLVRVTRRAPLVPCRSCSRCLRSRRAAAAARRCSSRRPSARGPRRRR